MNRGQAFYLNARHEVAFREDVSVAGALSLCASSHPVLAFGEFLHENHCGQMVRGRGASAYREKVSVRARMLEALRKAWRNGRRLSFEQLCEQLGLARSRHMRALLNWLCAEGVARRVGHGHSGRGTVYWAEDE